METISYFNQRRGSLNREMTDTEERFSVRLYGELCNAIGRFGQLAFTLEPAVEALNESTEKFLEWSRLKRNRGYAQALHTAANDFIKARMGYLDFVPEDRRSDFESANPRMEVMAKELEGVADKHFSPCGF